MAKRRGEAGRLARKETVLKLPTCFSKSNLVYLGLWPMIGAANLWCPRVRAAPGGGDGDDPEPIVRGF